MVGGYLYPLKPLVIGENNLAEMFGSYEAAVKRFNEVAPSKKPFFVSIITNTGIEACYPVISRGMSQTGADMIAGPFNVTIVLTTNTATATVALA